MLSRTGYFDGLAAPHQPSENSRARLRAEARKWVVDNIAMMPALSTVVFCEPGVGPDIVIPSVCEGRNYTTALLYFLDDGWMPVDRRRALRLMVRHSGRSVFLFPLSTLDMIKATIHGLLDRAELLTRH